MFTRKASSTVTLLGLLISVLLAPQAVANTGTIAGSAFKDLNRDGVKQSGEQPLANQTIYLFTLSPYANAGAMTTDANGNYSFTGLTSGGYRVAYQMSSWQALWMDWTPTTTGSARPTADLQLNGEATVNFGWRPITRSTDPASPITTFTGPNGLRAESFNDVVPARDIYDAVMRGLVGPEAQYTTVRFDLSQTSSTSSGIAGEPGTFRNFNAISYNDWITWVRYGDYGIAHEHGHVWSTYHETIVQQDGDYSGYLNARDLTGDSRVGSSYTWDVAEMIAEDYRLLFGSEEARQRPHMNSAIPAPRDVPGLENYLRGTFTTAPAGGGGSTGSPPVADTSAPTTPTALTAKAVKGSITLKWNPSSDSGTGVANYEIWRASGKTSSQKVASISTTSYSDTAVKRATVYTYYVVAVDGAGNRSTGSNQASAKAL